MFEIGSLNIEHFKVKFKDGLILDINPPKLKAIKRIMGLSRYETEEVLDDLIEVIALILSSNKQGKKISTEFVEENFEISDIRIFLTGFINWVKEVQNNPN